MDTLGTISNKLGIFLDYVADEWGIIVPILETRPIVYKILFLLAAEMDGYGSEIYYVVNSILCYFTLLNIILSMTQTVGWFRKCLFYFEIAVYFILYGSEMVVTRMVYNDWGAMSHHLCSFLIFFEMLRDEKHVDTLTLLPFLIHELYFLYDHLVLVVLYNFLMVSLGLFGFFSNKYGSRLPMYSIAISMINFFWECSRRGNERIPVCVSHQIVPGVVSGIFSVVFFYGFILGSIQMYILSKPKIKKL
jgi:hypothetical protein